MAAKIRMALTNLRDFAFEATMAITALTPQASSPFHAYRHCVRRPAFTLTAEPWFESSGGYQSFEFNRARLLRKRYRTAMTGLGQLALAANARTAPPATSAGPWLGRIRRPQSAQAWSGITGGSTPPGATTRPGQFAATHSRGSRADDRPSAPPHVRRGVWPKSR